MLRYIQRDIFVQQFRPSICLCVSPSETFGHCVKTAKHIIEVFSPPGSPLFQFLRTKDRQNEIPTESFSNGRHNYTQNIEI